jgi:hypothetical protein
VPTSRATEPLTADTVSLWYKRAASACDPFIFPESRFRTPWMNDELASVLQAARKWLRDNPCPDTSIGLHLQAILDAYAEMPAATVGRVMELRDVIESHGKEVDRRRSSRP